MIEDALILQKQELEWAYTQLYVPRQQDGITLQPGVVKVIVGPRRAGKSFYAKQLLKRHGGGGYVNFDDETLAAGANPQLIIETVKRLYQNPRWLLLDEIQNLPSWELFVNRLQRQGYELIVTGSNAQLLSGELATHLTGRCQVIGLYPFSFAEILKWKGPLTTDQQLQVFAEYLDKGGYPEPLVKQFDAIPYLQTLFEATLFKDLVKRHRLRAAAQLSALGKYCMTTVATEYSMKTLSTVLGVNSPITIDRYLSYLEEAFVLFRFGRFSWKPKERARLTKYAGFDPGMIRAAAGYVEPARLLENAVLAHLRRRGSPVYYWKSTAGYEVDAVLVSGRSVIGLVQVCYSLANLKTETREVRALLHAAKELRCDQLSILTWNERKTISAKWFDLRGTVKVRPVFEWLATNT
jgi:predicted AAA+ superfamily ATPase